MTQKQWHYFRQNVWVGPLDGPALKALAKSGLIAPATLLKGDDDIPVRADTVLTWNPRHAMDATAHRPIAPKQPGPSQSAQTAVAAQPFGAPAATGAAPTSSVRVVRPNLIWRRIAAVATDYILLVLLIMFFAIGGTPLMTLIAAWVAFFAIWLSLQLSRDASVGKLLVQIRTPRQNSQGEKTPSLLGRFAVTWLPMLLLSLPPFDTELSQNAWVGIVIVLGWVVCFIWFVAILVSLVVTKGHRGIHDLMTNSHADFSHPGFLPIWRKLMASASILIVFLLPIFAMIAAAVQPTLVAGEAAPGFSSNSRSDRYDPAEIRRFYESRVFEVSTRWQQPGGFLWLDSVEAGGQGTALMFVNSSHSALLVTNRHVAEPASSMVGGYQFKVRRTPQEPYVNCELVAIGKSGLDLALFRIQLDGSGTPSSIPVAGIAELQQGERVVAIGNGLGRGISVTDGLISMVEGEMGSQVIRTSTPISPGNSGGPLFLERGGLLAGITTWASYENGAQNVNYAIPVEYIFNSANWDMRDDARPAVEAMLRGEIGR